MYDLTHPIATAPSSRTHCFFVMLSATHFRSRVLALLVASDFFTTIITTYESAGIKTLDVIEELFRAPLIPATSPSYTITLLPTYIPLCLLSLL